MVLPESTALTEHSRSFQNLCNIPSEGDQVVSFVPLGSQSQPHRYSIQDSTMVIYH